MKKIQICKVGETDRYIWRIVDSNSPVVELSGAHDTKELALQGAAVRNVAFNPKLEVEDGSNTNGSQPQPR